MSTNRSGSTPSSRAMSIQQAVYPPIRCSRYTTPNSLWVEHNLPAITVVQFIGIISDYIRQPLQLGPHYCLSKTIKFKLSRGNSKKYSNYYFFTISLPQHCKGTVHETSFPAVQEHVLTTWSSRPHVLHVKKSPFFISAQLAIIFSSFLPLGLWILPLLFQYSKFPVFQYVMNLKKETCPDITRIQF